MRRAAKRDQSESEIIAALEQLGFTVTRLSQPNVPDLLISKPGWCGVAEVKTGKRKLRAGQQAFAAKWPTPVYVLRSADDALLLHQGLLLRSGGEGR